MSVRRNTPIRRTARFLRREDGTVLVFALFIILCMMLASGMAFDVVRTEVARSMLQNTLDRSVLAAADLDQTLEPEDVVTDYFDRVDLQEFLGDTVVEEGLGFRTVTADASADMTTRFMRLAGVPVIKVPTVAQANETVENVEISLVLDTSGSMRFDDRITPLRAAATKFVDMVLDGRRAQDTTINLVPYAGQTNPGPILFSLLGGVRDHNQSSCLFMENADFLHTGLPVSSHRQVPHFMKWDIAWSHMDWGWCPRDANRIRVHSNNATELKTFINTMKLHDGTGTQVGMKWALALLDPTSRDEVTLLRQAGGAPASAENRPLDWDEPSGQKFIVLMTDGLITDQFEPKYTGIRDIDSDSYDNEANDRDDIDGIDHDILNAELELDFQKDTEGRTGRYTKTVSSRSTNLANFYRMCDAAKAKGIIIYTIAFEAPAGASEEMRNCASTPANFFEVSQVEIGAAFSSIARQINQLRLTQ